ncbi:peptide-methionine (S)-S-oxide reductase MsrA [Liquorilactobacillus capillatus]|uniref:Peptide methionine sulfoxide reductase MsrA n=1 Tax=Liquorilactobacillus capillatus DSM 19910 TaxID=1423731 RepID=A0A0R1LZX0_9LACO|nr:peptide-methionine (S)-S-oxide reductase MsrA [Liquorilactobacillus capillatus]KRL01191.1 peptide methionine sulfoxide reductase [Liquorilactobacillus capillatus DSM 19910]
MEVNYEEILNDIYNLILNPATREWERTQLVEAKNQFKVDHSFSQPLGELEFALRPLALRNNLTPDVADFYRKITNERTPNKDFDIAQHQNERLPYQERAIFAGGCFWCMVEPFEAKKGIISVLSGYTGGHTKEPTYDQVLSGSTGHVEAVEIIFDTRIISYAELVELYWDLTDPTDEFGQIADRGSNYRPVIFVENVQQRQIAEQSKKRLIESRRYKRPIVTAIEEVAPFWPAENYHQQFYKKNPQRYKRIKRMRQQYLAFQNFQNKFLSIAKKFTKND